MGVYSSNRTQLGMYNSDEIVANENYYGVVGACQMMLEGFQNDQAIFESVLAADFMEAVAVQEGAVEYSVVNEASVSGFIDKLKELVKKIWEKIKGLFQTFMTKINNVVIRDNKKFVDKYKKEVLSKNLSKMKYKWAEPKEAGFKVLTEQLEVSKVTDAMDRCVGLSIDELKKLGEKASDNELLEEILGTEVKEYAKEMHEKCFDDEEEIEGLDSSRLTDCMDTLINSKTSLKNIEKAKTAADKAFNEMLKSIDKARNNVLKHVPGKGEGEKVKGSIDKDGTYAYSYSTGGDKAKSANDNAMTQLNTMHKVVSVANTAMSKASASLIAETKYMIKQARRVFAQAASFNPKAVKESALLVEAAGDAAEYEIESSFNDYEM